MFSAAKLAACLAGPSPVGVNCPFGAVLILSVEEVERIGESSNALAASHTHEQKLLSEPARAASWQGSGRLRAVLLRSKVGRVDALSVAL